MLNAKANVLNPKKQHYDKNKALHKSRRDATVPQKQLHFFDLALLIHNGRWGGKNGGGSQQIYHNPIYTHLRCHRLTLHLREAWDVSRGNTRPTLLSHYS
jgi:hypothetical protein